jgi:acyl-homoserine lactone acylase PvdQ
MAAGLLQAEAARAAGPRDVRIVRDEYGVPHVYADDLGALFFRLSATPWPRTASSSSR